MYKKLLIIISIFALVNITGHAMPTGDITQIIDVNYNDVTYSFLPDAYQSSIFYYIPQKIVFAKSVNTNKQNKPEFQMIQFQASSPELEKIYQGGILQFAFKFLSIKDLNNTVIDKLTAITKETQITVKDLPIEASDFIFLNASNSFIKGIQVPLEKFQINPNGNIPIGMTLTNKECNYFKELLISSNGLPIVARLNYKGITENMSLKITLNYTKAAKELSKNTSFRKNFNDFITKKPGIEMSSVTSTLRDTMISNSILKIEAIDKAENRERLDSYIDLFVDKIVKNVATLEPKTKKEISLFSPRKKKTITLAYGYSLKKQDKVTQVNETINFSGKTEVAIPLMAQGNLSIAHFMKEHKVNETEFIKFIKPSSVQSYFLLPELEDFGSIDIIKFSIKARLVNKYGKDLPNTSRSVVMADMQDLVWRDNKRAEREILAFGIPESLKNDRSIKYICDFTISYKMGKKNSSLNFSKEYPVFDGEIPITSIDDFIQVVTINGKRLEYNGAEKLKAVNINLSWGKSRKNKVIGTLSKFKKQLSFLVPVLIKGKDLILKGKLTFIAKKKKILKYKNILEERGNFIRLKNWEWQEAND